MVILKGRLPSPTLAEAAWTSRSPSISGCQTLQRISYWDESARPWTQQVYNADVVISRPNSDLLLRSFNSGRFQVKDHSIRSMWTVAFRLACLLSVPLVGCGGGGSSPTPVVAGPPTIRQFTSDRPSYFIGEQAQLHAEFANGTGRVQPGNIAILSGQTVTTPVLAASTTFHLTVEGGGTSVARELTLGVSYRERMRAAAMPFARARHAAVTMNDGRVLIVGGVDESDLVSRSMYIFDPSSETFSPFGSLVAGRIGFVAVALPDGNVLVLGGGSGDPGSVLIDAHTGALSQTANSPHSVRVFATGTLLNNGKVLIVGGLNDTTPDPTAEMYDPVTRTFSLLSASLAVPRYSHTALVTKDDRVFIYGGASGDGQPAPPESFDPMAGTFTKLNAAESNARANHSAVATRDGAIWIAGGDDGASALTAVIQFDAVSGALRHTSDLATPRTYLAATALTDGRVLIAGGAAESSLQQVTDTSELFDSATALRSAGPTMSTARALQTMTLLSNGKVLITGGIGQGHHALASAEIFE
jgi:hypothetical protein